MKRLTLVALKQDEADILKALQKHNAVQIISTGEAAGSEELEALRREVERIGAARHAIKSYYKKPMLAPALVCDEAELAEGRVSGGALCAKIEGLQGELNAKRAEADRHNATADSLVPFASLATPIEEIKPTKNIRYIAGVADLKALERVRALPGILDADVAVEEYPSEAGTGVLIGCFAIDREAILRSLKETAFAEFTFPAFTGTPAEVIRTQREAADRLAAECETIEQELRSLAKERLELDKAEDAAAIERNREENRCALAETDYAFVMDAWARADKMDEICAAVAKVTDAYHIDMRDPLDDETPPTVLKNKKLLEPYESIVEMYSPPAYRGIDSTPVLAPFYFLFFGMMLGDIGYGLILFIGGLLYTKLLHPKKSMEKLVRVIAYGGLSAALCGPFIGSLFGMDIDTVLGTGNLFPLLYDPMSDVMEMMILSCGLGLVHMFAGIITKMYMCFRDGDWQSAIFDQLSWMLLLTGLIGIFAFPALKTASIVLTALGGGTLLIFSGRPSKNPIKRLTKGFGALYGITGYLSDVLSYVRIFALGLVSGAMGMVFNLIGSLIYDALGGLGIPGVIIGVILSGVVLMALHVFSLFINTLGAFAHTARLQFIEFFGKFYEAGGVKFKPLSENTKNVQLLNRETDAKTV
jgi:V/A-type H+-transporting ATPase subunit I